MTVTGLPIRRDQLVVMEPAGFDRILVPTDLSDFADEALRYAHRFHEQFGSEIVLLHADERIVTADLFEHPLSFYVDNVSSGKQELIDALRRHAAARSMSYAETVVIQDLAARAIVNTARMRSVDLIIMGTHGRSDWRRAFLGSVTETVLHTAPCPVLAVKVSTARERLDEARELANISA